MSNNRHIRLVIPDAGVLISLAHGDLLDLLFSFRLEVDLVFTDVGMFEATRRTDKFDALCIREFMDKNAGRIEVDATGFHSLIEQAKLDPKIQFPDDIGEISIYGYINAMRKEKSSIPTLVLLEGKWFVDNQYERPRNTHLISLSAFLRLFEKVVPDQKSMNMMTPESISKELAALAAKPENEIDFSDIPATTEQDWQGAVRPLDRARRARVQALIGDVEVNLDEKLVVEIHQYEKTQEQLALLRLIALGRKEYKAGNFTEADAFFAEMNKEE